MPCTEIRVHDISQAASNRLGGVTEAVLDVPPGFSLRLSKDVERLSIVNKITTEGALGFSLPFSPTNDAVFIEYQTPRTVDNRVRYYRVSVRVGNHAVRLNRLVVKGRNSKTRTWDLELQRSPDHWVELASQLKVNQIDFGQLEMTEALVEDSWDAPVYEGDYSVPDPMVPQNPAVHMPVIDFGNWVDQSVQPQQSTGPYKRVMPEDMRPLVSLPYLLKRGGCQIGWTVEGIIFETDWFRRLWVYNLRPDYYALGKIVEGGKVIGRRFTRMEVKNTISTILRFTELVYGQTPNLVPAFPADYLCGITNYQTAALKYKITLKGDFTNEQPDDLTVEFAVWEVADNGTGIFLTGEVLSDPQAFTFGAGQTKTVNYEQEVILKGGQMGVVYGYVYPFDGFFVEPGMYFMVEPANQSLMTGDVVRVADLMSDQTTYLDWLKASVHLCNGRLDTDWETKTLTIYPNRTSDVFGETVPGFLLTEQASVEIGEKMVVNSIVAKPIRPDLKRYYRLEFARSTDAYIDSLNLTEPAHSRTLINGLDFPNEIESDENPLIEPTMEGRPVGPDGRGILKTAAGNRASEPMLPKMFDNTDAQRSFNIGPRVLYSFGLVRQIYPTPINPAIDGYASFAWGSGGYASFFGYATQKRTWELDPTPATDGNLIFGKAVFDLFVMFYLGLTQDARGGTTLDTLIKFAMRDYVGFNFRSLYAFKYNGIPLRVEMTGIRDFAPCQEISTPVTFFVRPSETACCDLPCGCQFTTCDYYQDFGPFMYQETLDALKLTSFVVDGIELVTTPIGFGLIKIVSIGTDPYVMNLIDTLNSVGAPYFSFDLSTRTHPTRGRRFFSIKHLACIPFRIVIKNGDNEVYLYTQSEQKTQWFTPGTWNDFGYTPDFYGEPIDCSTTTEY